jgi:NAD-dependent dihydropyrimidine dehydrogenase PreA subunit
MPEKRSKRFEVEISIDECKGCGRCVEACPKGILRMTDRVNMMGVVYVEVAKDGCVGCGACFYTCPEPGAITVYEITGEEGEKG